MAATDDRHLRHHWWERGNTKPHLSPREDAGASKLQKQPEIRAPLSDSINTVRNGSGVARRSPGKSAPKLIRATSKVLPWRNGGLGPSEPWLSPTIQRIPAAWGRIKAKATGSCNKLTNMQRPQEEVDFGADAN